MLHSWVLHSTSEVQPRHEESALLQTGLSGRVHSALVLQPRHRPLLPGDESLHPGTQRRLRTPYERRWLCHRRGSAGSALKHSWLSCWQERQVVVSCRRREPSNSHRGTLWVPLVRSNAPVLMPQSRHRPLPLSHICCRTPALVLKRAVRCFVAAFLFGQSSPNSFRIIAAGDKKCNSKKKARLMILLDEVAKVRLKATTE